MTVLLIVIALLAAGALAVLIYAADRARRCRALERRIARADAGRRALHQRVARLASEVDRARADLRRVMADLRAAREAALPQRLSPEREQERWADLLNHAVPEDRAGKYVPTPAEAEVWADLDRRLEET